MYRKVLKFSSNKPFIHVLRGYKSVTAEKSVVLVFFSRELNENSKLKKKKNKD